MSFGIDQRVMRLKSYNGSPSPILSVYFKLPKSNSVRNETIVNKLQSHINANLSLEQRKEMQKNIKAIVGSMKNYKQVKNEKTIAFFSGGENLFEVIHLPYEINTLVMYSHDPYLEPILNAQSSTRRYLVILNERKRSLLYTLFSGGLEDRIVLTNDTVPQDVKGNWPNSPRSERHDKVQRHVQDHVNQQFKYIANKASKFIDTKPISGVILGGHKSEMSQFAKYLPKNLRDKIVGEFVSELKVNFNEILAKSKEIVEKANREIDQQVLSYKSI